MREIVECGSIIVPDNKTNFPREWFVWAVIYNSEVVAVAVDVTTEQGCPSRKFTLKESFGNSLIESAFEHVLNKLDSSYLAKPSKRQVAEKFLKDTKERKITEQNLNRIFLDWAGKQFWFGEWWTDNTATYEFVSIVKWIIRNTLFGNNKVPTDNRQGNLFNQ